MATGTQQMVTGVDFICVPTQDFEASVKFYEEVLELPRRKQWGQMPGMEFQAGNLTLAIMDPTAFGLEFQRHSLPIAFQVPDVEAERERLRSHGVEFRGDLIDSGVCIQAFFADPDGNALGLHHRYVPEQ